MRTWRKRLATFCNNRNIQCEIQIKCFITVNGQNPDGSPREMTFESVKKHESSASAIDECAEKALSAIREEQEKEDERNGFEFFRASRSHISEQVLSEMWRNLSSHARMRFVKQFKDEKELQDMLSNNKKRKAEENSEGSPQEKAIKTTEIFDKDRDELDLISLWDAYASSNQILLNKL